MDPNPQGILYATLSRGWFSFQETHTAPCLGEKQAKPAFVKL